ncbi:hypothetical protein [Vibrio caribbeanicus]|nr:hypothetical protein [Vibrio caribbeanicus]MCY9845478.1 hypothetical protein [Vibrio caribbeanicus]
MFKKCIEFNHQQVQTRATGQTRITTYFLLERLLATIDHMSDFGRR